MVIIGNSSTGNSILTNAIWSNTGLGIDLNDDGVTLNHSGSSTAGPNALQNFPVLSFANSTGGSTWLAGTFNSSSTTSYRLEFFSSPAPGDPTGYGEGETYLGYVDVTTDASGNASFAMILPTAVADGSAVSATATVDLGDGSYGSTSEFSEDVTSTCLAQEVTVTPTSGLTTTQAGATATFTVVLNAPPISNVTIPIASSNTAQGVVNQSSLSFTASNWNIPQTVTVTGVNNHIADGDVAYSVTTGPAVSSDTGYNNLASSSVSLVNQRRDGRGGSVGDADERFGDQPERWSGQFYRGAYE